MGTGASANSPTSVLNGSATHIGLSTASSQRESGINVQRKMSSLFTMNWARATNGLSHEMSEEIANIVRSIVNDKSRGINKDDLRMEPIDRVVNILKNERNMSGAECNYLKEALIRAASFRFSSDDDAINNKKSKLVNRLSTYSNKTCDTCTASIDTYDSPTSTVDTETDIDDGIELFADIFDVHRVFKWFNYNFEKYTARDFDNDVVNAVDDEKLPYQIEERCSLNPKYIVDDDIFAVMNYHFGVSLFINSMKNEHQINIGDDHYVEIKSIVIPRKVRSIYDGHWTYEYDIDRVEKYLSQNNIYDFEKIKLRPDIHKEEIKNRIKQLSERLIDRYYLKSSNIERLVVIFERRNKDKDNRDTLYVFPLKNYRILSELYCNHFICFDFKIFSKKCICHFRFGHNEIMRFFPEFLVNFLPNLFLKASHISQTEYLDKIYSNKYKNGWCLAMNDDEFEKKYKKMTKFDFVSVCCDRLALDVIDNEAPIICFMDLLFYELQSMNVPIEPINECFLVNEYDSDSIIDDVLNNDSQSFIASNLESAQYEKIKRIVENYHCKAAKEKVKICQLSDMSNPEKCPFVQTIIDALIAFKEGNTSHINLQSVMAAYDHITTIHRFCALQKNNKIPKIQKYIADRAGGFCTSKNCVHSQKHIERKREFDDVKMECEEVKECLGPDELKRSCLNALHAYVLHKKKKLYRLEKSDERCHFVTKESIKFNKINSGGSAVSSMNWGVSVLRWLDFEEKPTFGSFKEEIIGNDQSSITPKMYLSYAQECYLKMINHRYKQFTLDEIIALKIYTDTNDYQSALRAAHRTSATKETRLSFYHWAKQIYKAFLFHQKPIIRLEGTSTHPLNLFHGIDKVLVVNNSHPRYNGPTSTSMDSAVAKRFSGDSGLVWRIHSSYTNKFKFITGVNVRWISHYSWEDEVILVDQYLPISRSDCFEHNPKNNVDHFLYSVKTYKDEIKNKKSFYKLLGFRYNKDWIEVIRKHHLLYVELDIDSSRTVLHRLRENLNIKELTNEYVLFTSRFELESINENKFGLCAFKLRMNNIYVIDSHYYHLFRQSKYRIDYGNIHYNLQYHETIMMEMNEYVTISIQNEAVFGHKSFILFQVIYSNDYLLEGVADKFHNSLKLKNNQMVVLMDDKTRQIDERAHPKIINCRFALVYKDVTKPKIEQIEMDQMVNGRNAFIKKFHSLNEFHFILPLLPSFKRVHAFIQLNGYGPFYCFKSFKFRTLNKKKLDKTEYLLQIIHLCHYKITDPSAFWQEIGFEIDERDIFRRQDLLNKKVYWNPNKTAMEILFERLHVSSLSNQYLRLIINSLHLKKEGEITSDHVFDPSMMIKEEFALIYVRTYGEHSFHFIDATKIEKEDRYMIRIDQFGKFEPWEFDIEMLARVDVYMRAANASHFKWMRTLDFDISDNDDDDELRSLPNMLYINRRNRTVPEMVFDNSNQLDDLYD